MKDEIKEILDYLAFLEDIDTQKKVKQVLDYITNLQEENEKFKEYARNYLKSKIDRKNEELELVKTKFIEEHNQCYDYKSRNEKAIKYINTHYLNANEPELLNILQGVGKDD